MTGDRTSEASDRGRLALAVLGLAVMAAVFLVTDSPGWRTSSTMGFGALATPYVDVRVRRWYSG